jgi:hypothetical protein
MEALATAGDIAHIGGGAPQPGRLAAVESEVIADPRRSVGGMVRDEDLVGQVEHDVALAGIAGPFLLQRLELENEVVAEGAVEPEKRVFRRGAEIADPAQQRENGRAPGAQRLVDVGPVIRDIACECCGAAFGEGQLGP